MGRLRLIRLATLACLTLFGSLASASETITYTYDSNGRLTAVAHSGSVNNNVSVTYTHDAADNRSNVTVTGASTAPSFSIGNASATEGGNVVFTVTRSSSAGGTLTVDYASANGTATAGSDYTSASNTLTFLTTDTSKTISVATTDDASVESAETFTVTLSNPSGIATIATASGTGTINDNDVALSFAISDPSAVSEGGTLVYTVTKTGSGAANVNFATASGTATSGTDFTSNSGTLTFTSGQTSQTVNVATIDDAATESAETVLVNLSSPTGGATISDSQGSGTISANDSPPPAFAISDPTAVTEGGTLVYTVTKSGSGSANVNFATASGTATSGSDFTANSGTLNFTASQTSQTINVVTINDTATESAETVLVNLSSATGGSTISDSQGSGTINDNDSPIALTDNQLQVLSGHTGVYYCDVGGYYDYDTMTFYPSVFCALVSNDATVFANYYDSGAQQYVDDFATGYSLSSGVLRVQPSYYGTAQ